MNVTRQRVLVVDDEPSIARTLAAILERRGFIAAAALSGREALELAPAFRPDLLLTDYAMPGMNGLEVAAAIVKTFPGCRVFMLTAYADTASFPKVARQPAVKFLLKPMPPEELLKALAQPDTPSHPGRAVVLMVDDVEPHRYSIRRLLTSRGLEVVEANTGQLAMEKLQVHPDAVLLDVNLPDMTGFEVCRRIRSLEEYRELPVIHFTSTYRSEEAAGESRASGADLFLEQPVDPNVLVAKIRDMIQKYSLEHG